MNNEVINQLSHNELGVPHFFLQVCDALRSKNFRRDLSDYAGGTSGRPAGDTKHGEPGWWLRFVECTMWGYQDTFTRVYDTIFNRVYKLITFGGHTLYSYPLAAVRTCSN